MTTPDWATGFPAPDWVSPCGNAILYNRDCLEVLPLIPEGSVDAVVTDPPYGETSLTWDKRVVGWLDLVPCNSLWCFGSFRFFMLNAADFDGWQFAQDVVWKKQNGSIFHADRFRRVHEHACHFYKGSWSEVYHSPVYTNDATKRTVRAKARPPHTGHIERIPYQSVDGGPRLQRSVIEVRSCHGHAVHPTQKPLGIIEPLVEYSSPESGIVLDHFCGSGTTGVASLNKGRKFIGIEIEKKYFDIACTRIANEHERFSLFNAAKETQAELFTGGDDAEHH